MIFARAPCKINLTLDVFDKSERTDGYHNLDSLVLLLDKPADELSIYVEFPADRTSIELKCTDSSLPVDRRNLAYRAAELFLTHISKPCRLAINLQKAIPTESGLGGGSSDAAAVLQGLNDYFQGIVDQTTLSCIASRLGADVPLFLARRPVRIRGFGEIIQPLQSELPIIWGIIVHPGTGVSTARAYALLDAIPDREPTMSTEKLMTALTESDQSSTQFIELLVKYSSNDFETAIFPAYPDVAKVYDMITAAGALRTLLCGSGAAVFGFARDYEHATQLLDTLAPYFPYVEIVASANKDSFLTKYS